jgi:hypothetical protein
MRYVYLLCALVAGGGCYREFHEFNVTAPSQVSEVPPPPPGTPGISHVPYAGRPKYLAEARPLYATKSAEPETNECASRTPTCDNRLRGVLASIDGQVLALSTPPTELQLKALRLATDQLGPLLAPYPDMMSEQDELASKIASLPTLTEIDQRTARRRLTELTDLLRVQLAAAQ